jgi:hypothetical protein
MEFRDFSKYAAFLIVIQSIAWLCMFRLDSFLEKGIYLYYPTVLIVEKFGNFQGEANIFKPIVMGVPIGIVLYSIIIAATLVSLKRAMRRNG